MSARLTEKQKRFVDAYIETGNASEAARRAGYKNGHEHVIGAQNLSKVNIQAAISARLKELESKRVASAKEVLEFLTSVLRGEEEEDTVTVEGMAPGVSKARIVKKKVSLRDRIKAAELLTKRFGIALSDLEIEEKKARIAALRQAIDAKQNEAEEVTIIDDTADCTADGNDS